MLHWLKSNQHQGIHIKASRYIYTQKNLSLGLGCGFGYTLKTHTKKIGFIPKNIKILVSSKNPNFLVYFSIGFQCISKPINITQTEIFLGVCFYETFILIHVESFKSCQITCLYLYNIMNTLKETTLEKCSNIKN